MRVVLFGAGETYTALHSAWVSEPRDDYIIFRATSDTSCSTFNNNIDQGGYQVDIDLNGFDINWGVTFCILLNYEATGDINIYGGSFSGDASNGLLYFNDTTGSQLTAFKVSCHDIHTDTDGELLYEAISPSWANINIWNINGNVNDRYVYKNTTTPVYFEDITLDGNNIVGYINHDSSVAASAFHAKRVYIRASGNSIFANFTPDASDFYIDGNDTEIPIGNRGIAFSEDNFVSIVEANPNYAEPLETSIMWTGADQTTNIPENVLGLNGRTVDRRAAGAYTPEPQILPPTNITRTREPEGLRVTWTNTVQAEYPKTSLYWEPTSPQSSFTTAKVVKDSGVTEHIIPWIELSSHNLWYLRAIHSA
jgi:hypothetical protein